MHRKDKIVNIVLAVYLLAFFVLYAILAHRYEILTHPKW
jgi:hypothetical protein